MVLTLSSFLSSLRIHSLLGLQIHFVTLDQWLIKDQEGLGNCRTSPFHLHLDRTVFLALMTADPYISVTSTTKSKPWCHPPLSLLSTPTLQKPVQGITSRKTFPDPAASRLDPFFVWDSSCVPLCLTFPGRLSAPRSLSLEAGQDFFLVSRGCQA